MTEETLNQDIANANAEAAASGSVNESDVADEGNAENAGEIQDAPAESASIASSEQIPTIGGAEANEPVLIGSFGIYRSRFDGQFLIRHEGGKGYSAPNASAAAMVSAHLVQEVVQESLNAPFQYAVGAQ